MRHGESLLNKAKAHSPVLFQTAADRAPFLDMPDHKVDLTPEGERQARVTGKALHKRGISVDMAYHSGYLRTKKTLDLALEAYPESERQRIQTRCSIFLREREAGFAYNVTAAESKEYFPWHEQYWQTHGPVFARPPGGESIADVIQRVNSFQKTMHEEAAGKDVLISLHGRVLAAMRFLYEDWSYEELEQFVHGGDHKNCGITIYEYSDEAKKMVLKEYNTCYWA